jgi:hypothetical protein
LHALAYLDGFLHADGSPDEATAVALVWVASKYVDASPVPAEACARLLHGLRGGNGSAARKKKEDLAGEMAELCAQERQVLSAIGWDLEVVTAEDFLPLALRVLDGVFDRRAGRRRIRDLIAVASCNHALLLEFSPGLLLAAAAVLVVRAMYWTESEAGQNRRIEDLAGVVGMTMAEVESAALLLEASEAIRTELPP